MASADQYGAQQQLTAVASILATGIIRLRCRAAAAETSENSRNLPSTALEHAAPIGLSVSTRVNEPESSTTYGDMHEH